MASRSGHVRTVVQIMTQRHDEQLGDLMHAVEADDLPARHSLLVALRRDRAAVTARADPALEFRPSRRQRQLDQDHRTTNVWPSQLPIATQTNPVPRMTATRSSPEPNYVSVRPSQLGNL